MFDHYTSQYCKNQQLAKTHPPPKNIKLNRSSLFSAYNSILIYPKYSSIQFFFLSEAVNIPKEREKLLLYHYHF